jgi:subtilisin family serine protease
MVSRLGSLVTGLMIIVLLAGTVSAAPTLIGEKLSTALVSAESAEMIPVIVLMSQRHDVEELSAMVEGFRSDKRKAMVWNEVSLRAEQSQEALLDHLYDLEQNGSVEGIRSLKMANGISVHATPAVIREIASRDDIFHIALVVEEKVIDDPVEVPVLIDELDEIVSAVSIVNAPAVWDMGFTGEGVLVAIIDTGCDYDHPDLADHLWDGGVAYPNHGYDFHYNDNDPNDVYGHGTHCAGTTLGDGTNGSQTGVAPDATLMALKVLGDNGNGSQPTTWAALDFCLEQGVDVTSYSIGWHYLTGTVRATFRDHYDIMNVAGIVNIAAAGNERGWGYDVPDNVRTPGDCPAPWLNPAQTQPGTVSGMITAGATNDNDTIASFSSYGPVGWGSVPGYNDFSYNPGTGLIKPDISAPGVNVRSLNLNNGYTNMSGTSMATPNIAGAAALLFSSEPNLTPAQICEALEMSAVDLGPPGMDNDFGAGRIDCEAAVVWLGNLADVNVILNPLYNPYYIPSTGGTMEFAVTVNNSYDVNTPGVVWTEAILPNGNTYPIQTYNVVYQPGVSINAPSVMQYVPGYAPSGTYSFNVHGGLAFGNPLDSESFEFTKFGNFPGADGAEGWDQSGFEVLTSDNEIGDVVAPTEFALGKAYPNPFNPTTSVSLSLPSSELVTVSVFNALGQEVAQLQNGRLSAGQHSFTFDASSLSSGVYFISAQAGVETSMQKVVLMK